MAAACSCCDKRQAGNLSILEPNTVAKHLGGLVSRAHKESRASVAAGDDGAWEAKLADFGLHATVEAMDRNKCALPLTDVASSDRGLESVFANNLAAVV